MSPASSTLHNTFSTTHCACSTQACICCFSFGVVNALHWEDSKAGFATLAECSTFNNISNSPALNRRLARSSSCEWQCSGFRGLYFLLLFAVFVTRRKDSCWRRQFHFLYTIRFFFFGEFNEFCSYISKIGFH